MCKKRLLLGLLLLAAMLTATACSIRSYQGIRRFDHRDEAGQQF